MSRFIFTLAYSLLPVQGITTITGFKSVFIYFFRLHRRIMIMPDGAFVFHTRLNKNTASSVEPIRADAAGAARVSGRATVTPV